MTTHDYRRATTALTVILALLAAYFIWSTERADATGDKVTFCHATGSASNPYVLLTTSVSAFYKSGHIGHPGDIYPAGKDKKGNAWPAQGDQSILANGCTVPGEPTPTEPEPTTPEPTEPTPTEPEPTTPEPTTPTETPTTPTETPTVTPSVPTETPAPPTVTVTETPTPTPTVPNEPEAPGPQTPTPGTPDGGKPGQPGKGKPGKPGITTSVQCIDHVWVTTVWKGDKVQSTSEAGTCQQDSSTPVFSVPETGL